MTAEGSPSRFWCGPFDPDPVVAQIGAVRLGMEVDSPILDTLRLYVRPADRHGDEYDLDPFFTKLTGITTKQVQKQGLTLSEALSELDRFSEGASFWSWGKDEFNMVAISAYVAGITLPIPAARFGNACKLVLAAGMPYDDVKRTRSDGITAYFGLDIDLKTHDALNDALSVAHALRHLLNAGRLSSDAFDPRAPIG